MITEIEAKTLAEKEIKFPNKMITKMTDKGRVWYINYATKECIETGQATISDYGNRPFIVDKIDGEIHKMPSIKHLLFAIWKPELYEGMDRNDYINKFIDDNIEEFLVKKYGDVT